jgi:Carboxypeptidase regulatory-like domain
MRLSGATSVLAIVSWVLAGGASDRLAAQLPPLARAAGHYSVKGVVTDTAGEPIQGAEVLVIVAGDLVHSVRSRADGRFELDGLRPVPVAVWVRRLGYRALTGPIRLRPDTAPLLNFVLHAMPSDIDGVVVRAAVDDLNGRLTEFYEHKRQSRFGYFFERPDIERRAPTHLSELLRRLRGVHLTPAGALGNRVLLRGCRPMVWLNGLRMPEAEVDEVAHPDEVAGVEVYVSMTGMPARFVDLVGKCGAVLIWTR